MKVGPCDFYRCISCIMRGRYSKIVDLWLFQEDFAEWLKIDIKNMVESALPSHMKGDKQKTLLADLKK